MELRIAATKGRASPLPIDDRRCLAVNVKPSISVLCVEGRQDAARYVADALNPEASQDGIIQVQTITDAELAAVPLEGFDAVFLCNVAEFTAREAERLRAFVRGGGGVAFFLGDRVRAERYNSELGQPAPGRASNLSPRGNLSKASGQRGANVLSAVASQPTTVTLVAATQEVASDTGSTQEPLLPVVIG